MSTSLKLALTGAALLAVLLGGTILLSGGGTGPGPTPAPTASPTPTPSPTPSSPLAHAEDHPDAGAGHPTTWTATVPATWSGAGTRPSPPARDTPARPGSRSGPRVPSTSRATRATGSARSSDGASVADVVAMLEARDDLVVSDPIDTTLGGYAGSRVDVEFPADLSACGDTIHPLRGAGRQWDLRSWTLEPLPRLDPRRGGSPDRLLDRELRRDPGRRHGRRPADHGLDRHHALTSAEPRRTADRSCRGGRAPQGPATAPAKRATAGPAPPRTGCRGWS